MMVTLSVVSMMAWGANSAKEERRASSFSVFRVELFSEYPWVGCVDWLRGEDVLAIWVWIGRS